MTRSTPESLGINNLDLMYLIKGWLRLMDQILEQFEFAMPKTKSLWCKKTPSEEMRKIKQSETKSLYPDDGILRPEVRLPHNFSYMYFGKCSSQTTCAHLNGKIYFLWNMLCFVTFKYVWIPWTQTYHPFIRSQLTHAGNKIG